LLFSVADYTVDTRYRARAEKRQHVSKGESLLECLDDTRPAEPVSYEVDGYAVPMLCLSIILQAVRDVRNDNDPLALLWLKTTGRLWLKKMGIARSGVDEEVYRMIYGEIGPEAALAWLESDTEPEPYNEIEED
jgi:hypothetical protein